MGFTFEQLTKMLNHVAVPFWAPATITRLKYLHTTNGFTPQEIITMAYRVNRVFWLPAAGVKIDQMLTMGVSTQEVALRVSKATNQFWQ